MRIKASPDDFLVEEIPAYEPSGEGEHVYVRFTKRGLNTDDAVRALCKATGANAREAGVAGLKDKVGVTTQTISLFLPIRVHPDAEAKIRALERLKDKTEEAPPAEDDEAIVIKGNQVSKGTSLSGDAKEQAQAGYYDLLRDSLAEYWSLPVWLQRQSSSAPWTSVATSCPP